MLPLLEIYFLSSGEIIGQGWEELQTGRTVAKQRIRDIMGDNALKKKAEKDEKSTLNQQVPHTAWICSSNARLS